MITPDDVAFMARAMRLAERGRFTTHPNPRVGCVLVKEGRIVGEGFHRRAGEPHAERNALAAAGGGATGATAYVTLEPCCHYGRTPPCTEGLIEAGVARVVVAMEDPSPKVAGQGLSILREAGIEVTCGVLEAEARALNPGFTKRMREGLPWVRCKLAMSLDGRTAMASGESRWITGEAARLDVQRLRAASDAILTGIGTVLADDPSLNVRADLVHLPGVESESYRPFPLRVVLDPRGEMPAAARMLALPGKTLVLTSRRVDGWQEPLERAGAEVVQISGTSRALDLRAVLRELAQREINELLIESGPTLAGAALVAGIIDELVIYAAPHLMGAAARGLFNLAGVSRMQERIELEIGDLRMVGRDIRITATPKTVSATTTGGASGPNG